MKRSTPGKRFGHMEDAERDQVLQQHLTTAERHFKAATGQNHFYFGVETAGYYCDWLMLFAPEVAAEFLQALIACHGLHDEETYGAATLRLKRAKMNLHIHLTTKSATRLASCAQSTVPLQ